MCGDPLTWRGRENATLQECRYQLQPDRRLTADFEELWGDAASGVKYFKDFRNKCVHWMAPVSVELAKEIREFFGGFVMRTFAVVDHGVAGKSDAVSMANRLRELAELRSMRIDSVPSGPESAALAAVRPRTYEELTVAPG